ncbi:SAM-dependent methyltransferase [Micromonospora sp. NPDC051296]|uniref:SAM-dependent methyltransferase n=1 Tax=Micromonospora sp. NPDC051296 TaxID=3155046 RepID=UPI00343D2ED6
MAIVRRPGDAPAPAESVSHAEFTDLYTQKPDPWDLATKWYDQRKYAITVASLPRPHYRRCYEPGCSIGELTKLLAARCDELLATDFVESAVAQARTAVQDLTNVTVTRSVLPTELPDGPFDLVVVSELLYYLSTRDMKQLVDGIVERLEPHGDLVAVHYRDDRRRHYDGVTVHAELLSRPQLHSIVHYEDEAFILDILRRRTHGTTLIHSAVQAAGNLLPRGAERRRPTRLTPTPDGHGEARQ